MDNVPLIGAVVAVVLVAFWLVRRTRTKSDDVGLETFGVGWQFYPKPTALEPPGTVFRIDGDRRRYLVESLDVRTSAGEEAFGRHRESVDASMGVVAQLLGVAKATARASTVERLTVELDRVARETLSDVEADRVIGPFLGQLRQREDSRYYVIREARSAGRIIYHFTRKTVDDLGGEAELRRGIGVNGTLYATTRTGDFTLERSSETPLRVMFLAEEITSRASVGEATPRFELRPVREPLAWEDEATETAPATVGQTVSGPGAAASHGGIAGGAGSAVAGSGGTATVGPQQGGLASDPGGPHRDREAPREPFRKLVPKSDTSEGSAVDPLAGQIVAIMTRYAVDGGVALTMEHGQPVADAVGRVSEAVLARLRTDPAERTNIERFETRPDRYRASIEDALTAEFERDPAFAAELQALLPDLDPTTPATVSQTVSGSGAAASHGGIAGGAGSAVAGPGGTAVVFGSRPDDPERPDSTG